MYQLRSRLPIVWSNYITQVSAGTTRDLVPGDEVTGLAGITGTNVVPILDLDWFCFWMRASHDLNLIIQIGPDSDPASLTTWITFAYLTASGVQTTYNLAAPYGGATSQGRVGLAGMFMRLRIENPGGAATTTFQFMARAWHV